MDTELTQMGRRLLRAYAQRDYLKVASIARDYLSTARNYPGTTDYGNAVHQANTLLGLVELHHGRVDRAAEHLLDSARTPGSPQIKAFGPNMLLAARLLEAGQQACVLRYLNMCRRLWMLSFGSLRRWSWQIRRGRRPDFGANLSYLTDYKSFG